MSDELRAAQEQIETYYRASQEWLRIEAELRAEIKESDRRYVEAADRYQFEMESVLSRAEVAEAKVERLAARLADCTDELVRGRCETGHQRRRAEAAEAKLARVEQVLTEREEWAGAWRGETHVLIRTSEVRRALASTPAESADDLDGGAVGVEASGPSQRVEDGVQPEAG